MSAQPMTQEQRMDLLFAVGIASYKDDPKLTAWMRRACRRLKYSCSDCGGKFPWDQMCAAEGVLGPDLCIGCLHKGEIENAHSDGHHREFQDPDCPECFPNGVAA